MPKRKVKKLVKRTKRGLKLLPPGYPERTDKTFLPSYLEVNGNVYEKLEEPSVSIEIDMSTWTEEQIATIEKAIKVGGFLSKQEYFRHVIREMVKKYE